MIQHFVCFRFKDSTSPEAVQQHLDMFAELKDKIPQIVDYSGGPVVPGEERKFDTAHNVADCGVTEFGGIHPKNRAGSSRLW